MIVEKRLELSASKEIDRLNRMVSDLTKENRDLQERLEFAEQSAACYYEQLYGETLPDSWEWSSSDEDRACRAGDLNAPLE